jgi:NADH-quinone oxidoreductase subunit E
MAALEKELGIKPGDTTPDGKFTLEFTECVGQCQATPVITINRKPYHAVTPAKLPDILKEYQ